MGFLRETRHVYARLESYKIQPDLAFSFPFLFTLIFSFKRFCIAHAAFVQLEFGIGARFEPAHEGDFCYFSAPLSLLFFGFPPSFFLPCLGLHFLARPLFLQSSHPLAFYFFLTDLFFFPLPARLFTLPVTLFAFIFFCFTIFHSCVFLSLFPFSLRIIARSLVYTEDGDTIGFTSFGVWTLRCFAAYGYTNMYIAAYIVIYIYY